MVDLKAFEKSFLASHIKEGGVCCDFTMGNGHDTLWLSHAVGERGKVYAFDIQPLALESTEKTLSEGGAYNNAVNYVHEKICAGVFNLGYLPGSDKKITTMRETTMKAVRDAVSMLDDDGIVLIAVYPGHAEGTAEGEMLLSNLSSEYDRRTYCVSLFKIINSPTSPFVISVEKK